MNISSRLSILVLLGCLVPLDTPAHAQPDTNNAPKANNPANRPARPDPNLPPAERMRFLVKRQFSLLGADDATQDILVTFIQGESKARQDLEEKGQPLQSALRAGALSDTQIVALLNSYQVTLEDEKTRHTKAVAGLNKAIDFKKLPKVEAALTLSGLIGDGPMLNLGGNMGRALMGGMAQGGRGGRGQNQRGNRNPPNPVIPPNEPAQGA